MSQEKELMDKIARGDRKAFEHLLQLHRKIVFGTCLRMMGSEALAEDMTQDTWVKVVRGSANYSEKAPLQAWILRIAKNTCLNELRKRKWEEELTEEKESDLKDPQEGLEEFLMKQSDLQQVKNCMNHLPANQRAAVVLSVSEEISHSEISQQMGLQINAVKQLLFRARQGLMKCLGVRL